MNIDTRSCKKESLSWLGILKVASRILVVLSILTYSNSTFAESSRRAFTHSFKAFKQNPVVKEIIKDRKYKVDHQVKKVADFVGENAPAIIALGVVTKLALDGKIGHKGKLTKNTSYNVNMNISGEVSSGFYGKIDNLKDSTYDVTAYSKGTDQGLRVGLKFSFD